MVAANRNPQPESQPPDPAEVATSLLKMATDSQRLFAEFIKRQAESPPGPADPDPIGINRAFMEAATRFWSNPAAMVQAQADLWQQYMELWQRTAARGLGGEAKPVVEPERGDKRFRDPAWQEMPQFDFVKQSYLLTSRWLLDTVQQIEGLDPQTRQKVEFYTRQFADAVAPSNFVVTNPQVLRATIESGGKNLVEGVQNLIEDIEAGRPTPKMIDPNAFEVGKDLATTPGKVVFQNDLMQLIQYQPVTEEVYRQPLLIVPPWINKYYILDLRPQNSFIRWALEQGYTVFVVSWANPDARLAEKTFDDYALEGPLAALQAIEQATGERQVSAIGYCIGGTLMASLLAFMAAHGDDRIQNCTFLAAQVDFADAGELSVFIDEEQIQYLERRMEEQGGYLDAGTMFTTFNLLRANDLIWNYVVNNYLLGKEPPPFDLLYWNSDTTNLPAKMHSHYLRNLYQRNLLVQPGALQMGGTPLDLTKISIPIYLQSAKEDHIAPFKSVYKANHHFQGPVRTMLAGSGHVAGVINHPAAGKYQYWTGEPGKRFETPEEWLAHATEHPGSWWPDWSEWLAPLSGDQVPARSPGGGGLPVIEDAPGTYVRSKATG